MSTHILHAPVGGGKTEYVLNQITRTLNTQPFARIWVALATKRQEDAFRQRLIDWDTGKRAFFNVEFFNFYELYTFLLDMAGNPQRQLNEAARFALLKSVITDVADDLRLFHTIYETTGFLRIVADFIYELKQNRIYPEDYQAFAQRTGSAKDHDLALIYAHYQAQLQTYNLVDKEGQGWLAVDALIENINLADNLALFIVDGFDQFNPVQADLVSLLADRSAEGLITLTRVPGREATVGRRFEQALARLQERDPSMAIQPLSDSQHDRHADLQHVIDQSFLKNPTMKGLSGGMNLVEVPGVADEVALVLRRVKALLLDGVPADEIMIAVRDWERYRSHFLSLRDKYQLPLVLHYGEPLEENPAINALLTVLNLHENDFRRRDVLDVLRSPYFRWPTLTDATVDLLDHISQQYTVIGGREIWLTAIRQASQPTIDLDDVVTDALLSNEEASQLQADLDDFFAIVTPPDQATVSEYAYWVDSLLGYDPNADNDDDLDTETTPSIDTTLSLQMIRSVRAENAPDEIIARDVMALHELKQVLRGLLVAQELLHSLDNRVEPAISWERFATDLMASISGAAVNPRPSRYGRVLVTTTADARGLPHDHVFILGLSEGIFPATTPEDPLYLDSERREMRIGDRQLETQAERAADDGVFYELLCLPRQSLTLTRPTMQEGKPWMASPLWRGVTAVFDDAESHIRENSLRLGQVIPVEQATALDEVVVAASSMLKQSQTSLHDRQWQVLNWLIESQNTFWSGIRHGRTVEIGRLSTAPFDRYSGRLQEATLIQHVRTELDGKRLWSASQFNDYGVCGFRFFAKRLLNLEAVEEPAEGMDAAQHGTLNHAILERTYRQIRDQKLAIMPDNLEIALNLFHAAADDVFANASEELDFRAGALWNQEQRVIRRKLEQLIRKDFAAGKENPINKAFKDSPRNPRFLEVPFGTRESDVPVVMLDLGEGIGPVRILGYIDRIDQQDDGYIVIDYKSGSTGIPVSEMAEGRNFQMLVYLEGVQALLARQETKANLEGGAFWHITNQKLSGAVRLDEDGLANINQAKAHLARNIELGREGDFAVHANKPTNGRCVRYCEFSQLCRMSSTNHHKLT